MLLQLAFVIHQVMTLKHNHQINVRFEKDTAGQQYRRVISNWTVSSIQTQTGQIYHYNHKHDICAARWVSGMGSLIGLVFGVRFDIFVPVIPLFLPLDILWVAKNWKFRMKPSVIVYFYGKILLRPRTWILASDWSWVKTWLETGLWLAETT